MTTNEFQLEGRRVSFINKLKNGQRMIGYVSNLIALPAEPGYNPVVHAIVVAQEDGSVHQLSLQLISVI